MLRRMTPPAEMVGACMSRSMKSEAESDQRYRVDRPWRPRIRVAVVFGGRSSEHGISVVSAGSVLRRARSATGTTSCPIGITPAGQWVLHRRRPRSRCRSPAGTLPEVETGDRRSSCRPTRRATALLAVEPGRCRRALGERRRRLPGAARPLRRGRHDPGPARDGRRALRRAGRLRQRGRDGQGVHQEAAAPADGLPVGRYVVVLRRGSATVRRGRSCATSGCRCSSSRPGPGRASASPRCTDWADLDDAVELAFEHDPKVLVEAAVVGREIECGVLEDGRRRARGQRCRPRSGSSRDHDWYDFEAKYLDDACEFDIPADLPDRRSTAADRASSPAAPSPRSTAPAWPGSTSSSARRGEVVVNEVNTMPGFTPDLDVPADVGGIRRRLPDAGRPARRRRAAPALTVTARPAARAPAAAARSRPRGLWSARCGPARSARPSNAARSASGTADRCPHPRPTPAVVARCSAIERNADCTCATSTLGSRASSRATSRCTAAPR